MNESFIIEGVRTPIGSFGGTSKTAIGR